jgi:penicillin-binding protein 1A
MDTTALKRHWWKILLAGVGVLLLAGGGLFMNCGFHGCPDVKLLRAYIPDEASVVLDRNGAEIAKLYRVKRTVISLDSMPKYVPQAFVAVEDQRFFQHHGVDWQRVPGAFIANLKSRGVAQGFSTITMQLARNVFPDKLKAKERTLRRKLAEMRVAMKIERQYSKNDILELYLNQIFFGSSAWGIEAASQEYFGKHAKDLTVAEAALLGGLPQAPSRGNPRVDPVGATKRRNNVLDKMAQQGVITVAQAEEARQVPLRLRRGRLTPLQGSAPYFVEEVRQLLEDQLGDAVYTQGLKIHTTLDASLQQVAQEELARQMVAIESGAYGAYRHPRYAPAKPGVAADSTLDEGTQYLQGALIMEDARNGEVLAWIGGRDFNDSKFDRAMLARRQPGSAFKPFVYTAAVEAGYPPNYRIPDSPLRLAVDRNKYWEPQNYDHRFLGVVSLRDALAQSRNVPTVRLAEAVGVDRVIDVAHQLGITSPLPRVPSVVLGTAEVTPIELTGAYTPFATLGTHVAPVFVMRVEDRSGGVVWQGQTETRQVLDQAAAFVMTDMLKDVVNRGTATAVRAEGYTGPAAGKTGTTQDGADAWFIGFTPRIVGTIWLGLDKRQQITADASGGHIAAPVWGRIMKRVNIPAEDWLPPPGVEKVSTDANGQVVSAECPGAGGVTRTEYYVSSSAPQTGMCMPASMADTSVYVAATDTMLPYGTQPAEDGWWARMRQRIFGSDSAAVAERQQQQQQQQQQPVTPEAQTATPQPQPVIPPAQPERPGGPELLGKPAPPPQTQAQPSTEPRRETQRPETQRPAQTEPAQPAQPEPVPQPTPQQAPPPDTAKPAPRDTTGGAGTSAFG